MDTIYVDINCDVGEGMGNEAILFPFISSCSIACGGHAGNQRTMLETSRLAKQYGVKVGAHPAYPDRDNFGRVSLTITEHALIKSVREQIDSLLVLLKSESMELHHVKAHGALYNDVSKDFRLAGCFLDAVEDYKSLAHLYAPYNSVLANEGEKRGFSIKWEAFGDRRYLPGLSLVPRNRPNALIQEPKEVLKQVRTIVRDCRVPDIEGGSRKIFADTICIHGDTPSVLQIVSYLSERLPNYHIQIKR